VHALYDNDTWRYTVIARPHTTAAYRLDTSIRVNVVDDAAVRRTELDNENAAALSR